MVTSVERSWFSACVRVLFALRCSTFSILRVSTAPSCVFGVAVAAPDMTARPAAMASTTSVLPWRRRTCRFGRDTSKTPEALRRQVSRESGAVAAGALNTNPADGTEAAQPGEYSPVAGGGGRIRGGAGPAPRRSRAAVTFRSRWVSTPPGTGPGGNRLLLGQSRRSSCQVVIRAGDGSARRQPSGAGSSVGQSRAGDCRRWPSPRW